MVVSGLWPMFSIKNLQFQANVRDGSASVDMFIKYADFHLCHVKKTNISLLTLFAIMFGGQLSGNNHYVGII